MRRVMLAGVLLLFAAACGGGDGGEQAQGSPSPIPPAPVEPSGTNDPPLDAEGPVAYALLFGEGPVAVDTANGQVINDFQVPAGDAEGVEIDPDDGLMLFHRAPTGTEAQVVELHTDNGTENVRLSDAAWPATEQGGHRWAHVESRVVEDGTRTADVVVRNRIGEEVVRWAFGAVPSDTEFDDLPLRNLAWGGGSLAVQTELDDERTVVLVVPVDSGEGSLSELATELSPPDDRTELAAPAYRGDQLTVAVRPTGEVSGTSRVVTVSGDGVAETIVDGIEGRVLELDWDQAGKQLLLIVEDVAGDTRLLVWDGSELREVLTGVTSAAW